MFFVVSRCRRQALGLTWTRLEMNCTCWRGTRDVCTYWCGALYLVELGDPLLSSQVAEGTLLARHAFVPSCTTSGRTLHRPAPTAESLSLVPDLSPQGPNKSPATKAQISRGGLGTHPSAKPQPPRSFIPPSSEPALALAPGTRTRTVLAPMPARAN
ncbi:hypothetical protein OH77DRAFT_1200149 [Trametes cingulata]|nr:hypothetical protein OH77DRAFT_1200149 [Trametes cingulata]